MTELMPLIITFFNLVIVIAIIFGVVFSVKYVKSRDSFKRNLEERVRKLEEKVNK